MDVAAMLPWWVGVALACISYLVLHSVATASNPMPTDMKAMGDFAGRQLWITFASIFQWILPLALLMGAVMSALKGAQRKRLHDSVAKAPSRGALESMHWAEFEVLVGELFRRKGYTVQERGQGGADGGVDLELHLGQDKYLVQCKQWKSRQVGVAVVRELFGVMAAEGAVGGFVVASGSFTEDAKRFAEGKAIELVPTERLLKMVDAPRPVATGRPSPVSSVPTSPAAPLCPTCAAKMMERVAKRGANAGRRFWGCSRYPGCKGTREV